jgi:hypothetical protein
MDASAAQLRGRLDSLSSRIDQGEVFSGETARTLNETSQGFLLTNPQAPEALFKHVTHVSERIPCIGSDTLPSWQRLNLSV